jgi:3-hydroxybutyryl-CoA dehydrogenase
MAREFTTVGVIGLGTMGAGIAEIFARNGLSVVAIEVDGDALEHGKGILAKSTARAVGRGKLSAEDAEALHGRISYATDLAQLAGCELIVEAVPEHLALKKQIFAALDAIVPDDAILATNTSSLSVTELAVATKKPSRVLGMHFFNPATVMQFVEVIRTVVTSDDVFNDVKALAERLDKKPVVVGDKAGFIANALLFGYLNHAVSMYEQKYATREDLDAAMRFGCGLPMGPLALMDLIGLDTAYEILDTMYHQGRDRLHAPRPVIKQMVNAGLKGRKSGRGFYTYAAQGSSEVVADGQTPKSGAAEDPGLAKIAKVGVVGSGTMATGIMEVFAKAGFDVVYVARGQDKVDGVLASIKKGQARMIERGRRRSLSWMPRLPSPTDSDTWSPARTALSSPSTTALSAQFTWELPTQQRVRFATSPVC